MFSESGVLCELAATSHRVLPNGNVSAAVRNGTDIKAGTSLALSSAVFAFILCLVSATPSTNAESSETVTNSGAKMSQKGGGGDGGDREPLNSLGVASKKAAEDDVRKVEEEAFKTPYQVSKGAEQGARWTMEDTYTVETGGRFVAVFDGHGGSDVSTILQDRLHGYYREILSSRHWEDCDDFRSSKRRIPSIASHVAALRRALERVEADVIKEDHLVYQGSTAVVVVIHVAEDGRRTLLSANVGDSRAILSRKGKAIDLTRDHKPNDEREKARIRALGEDIEWDPYGEVYRVRDLSLSRVIGDRFAKPVVCNEPEIKHFPVVVEDDEFILLGSDGLFDVMESQEVVDFVHENLNETPEVPKSYLRQMMAKNIANEALERGTADNVCVLLVWLKDADDS